MLFSKFLFCILILFTLTLSAVKSQGFKCKTTTKCQSQVGYLQRNATTLSQIATHKSISVNSTIKIPFTCSCNNGKGISDNSPIYNVTSDDFLDRIARDLFSLLITYQEIAAVNNISNPDLIDDGQLLWIPLPCSCDNLDGNQVVHYAHVVVRQNGNGDLGVTVESILKLNDGNEEPNAETVLDVPLRVTNTSPDYPLLAPSGTYTLTANNCIKCKCDSINKYSTLHCEPSPPEIKVQNWQQCPSVRCIGSGVEANRPSYALGKRSYIDNTGCNETRCAYTGYDYQSREISASLVKGSICPGEYHYHILQVIPRIIEC
ncbi:hypothetical protein MKX03_034897 [Papaver bracteatum]|nr:hypothetical protein MKX03_034897 [Papaver bracteatum]